MYAKPNFEWGGLVYNIKPDEFCLKISGGSVVDVNPGLHLNFLGYIARGKKRLGTLSWNFSDVICKDDQPIAGSVALTLDVSDPKNFVNAPQDYSRQITTGLGADIEQYVKTNVSMEEARERVQDIQENVQENLESRLQDMGLKIVEFKLHGIKVHPSYDTTQAETYRLDKEDEVSDKRSRIEIDDYKRKAEEEIAKLTGELKIDQEKIDVEKKLFELGQELDILTTEHEENLETIKADAQRGRDYDNVAAQIELTHQERMNQVAAHKEMIRIETEYVQAIAQSVQEGIGKIAEHLGKDNAEMVAMMYIERMGIPVPTGVFSNWSGVGVDLGGIGGLVTSDRDSRIRQKFLSSDIARQIELAKLQGDGEADIAASRLQKLGEVIGEMDGDVDTILGGGSKISVNFGGGGIKDLDDEGERKIYGD